MDDSKLQVGDHIEVLGFFSFLNAKGMINRCTHGSVEIYLCERKKNGFWKAKIFGVWAHEPEILLHRSAFNAVIEGVKTFEVKLKPGRSVSGIEENLL